MRSLTIGVALALLLPASAIAGAFPIVGEDSKFSDLPYSGSPVATAVRRDVRAVASLPDGRVAYLETGPYDIACRVGVLDRFGRLAELARLPAPYGVDVPMRLGYDLEAVAGALLAVCRGRVHRVELSGGHKRLHVGGEEQVRGLHPQADGSLLLASGTRVVQVLGDDTVVPVAGSGAPGKPRPGPALAVPAGEPLDVLALPDGRIAFTDGASRAVWTVRAGRLARLAGGGRRSLEDVPARGSAPARAVALYFDEGGEMLWLGARGLAFLSTDGVRSVRSGRIREVVRGSYDTPMGLAPLWAGGPTARSWVYGPAGLDRTARGELLIGSANGIVMHTARRESSRLAVALTTATQRTVWRREVQVALTRRARVRVRVRVGKRTVATASGTVAAGRSSLRLSRRLRSGVNRVEVRATAADGAIATHRLAVLGQPRLRVADAARTLITESDTAGDVVSIARDWRRLGPRTLRCRLTVGSEGAIFSRTRPTVTLRRDGWIEVREHGRRYRLQVL